MPKRSFSDDAAKNGFLHSNLGKIRLNISSVKFASPQFPQTKTYRKLESATQTDEIPFRGWLALRSPVLNKGTNYEDPRTRRISAKFQPRLLTNEQKQQPFLPAK